MNAGIQIKIDGSEKNRESMMSSPAIKSTKLRTSPVMANKPLVSKRIAIVKKSGLKGGRPKIKVRNIIAATKSIPPRIFNRTMEIAGKKRI
ncbi:hypothetical protein J4462_03520 [Candidatus Pacearchaeota archaeon]|nr:hypothetical protein [Candidatus Pacearchaeota archaeon]